MYYGLSSPIEFDLESGLSPMNNVIVHLGAVRFEVTFEDMENFELIQKLPTENVYVSAAGMSTGRFRTFPLWPFIQILDEIIFQTAFTLHDSLLPTSTLTQRQASHQCNKC